jgi:hypothetical protein
MNWIMVEVRVGSGLPLFSVAWPKELGVVGQNISFLYVDKVRFVKLAFCITM